MDELLHLIVALIGQFILQPVDPRMAVALRIAFGQSEFHIDVRGDVHEPRHDLPGIRIQFPEIRIQDVHGIVDLGVGNVLLSVVVDHMEHHGNDVQLIVAAAALQQLPRLLAGGLFRGCTRRSGSRMGGVKGSLGVRLSTGEDVLSVDLKGQGHQQGRGGRTEVQVEMRIQHGLAGWQDTAANKGACPHASHPGRYGG